MRIGPAGCGVFIVSIRANQQILHPGQDIVYSCVVTPWPVVSTITRLCRAVTRNWPASIRSGGDEEEVNGVMSMVGFIVEGWTMREPLWLV